MQWFSDPELEIKGITQVLEFACSKRKENKWNNKTKKRKIYIFNRVPPEKVSLHLVQSRVN